MASPVTLQAQSSPQGGLILPRKSGEHRLGLAEVTAARTAVANGLGARGVRPGDRVLVLLTPGLPLVALLAGCWDVQAVPVFVEAFARALLQHVKVDLVVGSPRAFLAAGLAGVRRPVGFGPPGFVTEATVRDWIAGAARSAAGLASIPDLTWPAADPSAPGLVTYSTGSQSGVPRLVTRSHGVLAAQRRLLSGLLPSDPRPVYSAFPMVGLMFLSRGAEVILPEKGWRAAEWPHMAILSSLRRLDTGTIAAPPLWWRRASAVGLRLDLGVAAVGGGPVTAPVVRAIRTVAPGARVVAVYGATEAEPVTAIDGDQILALADDTACGKGVPVGRPVPGTRLHIEDDAGQSVPDGGVGRLRAAGDQVVGGSHAMSETGYMDAGGSVWLVGLARDDRGRWLEALAAAASLRLGAEAAVFVDVPTVGGARTCLVVRTPPGWSVAQAEAQVRGFTTEAASLTDADVAVLPHLPMDRRHGSRVDKLELARMLREPWPMRFGAYLRERFPPASHAVLIASYFSANFFLARLVAPAPGPGAAKWLAGVVAFVMFFFILRVVDEHRDFESDRVVHPDRLLSRGVVDLSELRRAGLVAAGTGLLLSASMGGAALITAGLILGYVGLVAADFFSRRLHNRMFTNALAHMGIMPILSLFGVAAASGLPPWSAPPVLVAYAWVGFGAGLAFEVARKIRAPEDERPGLVTYSAHWGPFVPAAVVMASLAASGGLSVAVGRQVGVAAWYHWAVVLLMLGVAASVVRFRLRPNAATAAALQTVAAAFIVAFDWLLVAEVLRLLRQP